MSHSKLPWEAYTMKIGFPIIIHRKKAGLEVISKLIIDETSPNEAEQAANAQFIVTACNEYDTLKAKAELFDEMVAGLEIISPLIAKDKAQFPNGTNFSMVDPKRINKLLSKAKEL